MSEIPSYLTTRDEQRLYYLAREWAGRNAVSLAAHGFAHHWLGKVMQELEDAGALTRSEEDPPLVIAWRPPDHRWPEVKPSRKPAAMAEALENLKRTLESGA